MTDLDRILSLATSRGMKVSKAAARLGFSPAECKAFSVASKIEILTDEDEMVNAVKTHGRSCMSASPSSYRYWAQTHNEQGDFPMAVAIYGNSRCLVRTDNKTFCAAYGSQSGELMDGLRVLGYQLNEEAFSKGLNIPAKITETISKTIKKTVSIPHVADHTLVGVITCPLVNISYQGTVIGYYEFNGSYHRYEREGLVSRKIPQTKLGEYKNRTGFKIISQAGFGLATVSAPYYECKKMGDRQYYHPKHGVMNSCRIKNIHAYKQVERVKIETKTVVIKPPYHDGLRTFL